MSEAARRRRSTVRLWSRPALIASAARGARDLLQSVTFDAHLTPPRSRPAAPRPRPRQRRRQPRAHPVLLVYSLLPSDIPRDNLSRLNRSSGRFSVLYSLAHGRLLLEPLPIPLPRQLQRRKFHHDDNDDAKPRVGQPSRRGASARTLLQTLLYFRLHHRRRQGAGQRQSRWERHL